MPFASWRKIAYFNMEYSVYGVCHQGFYINTSTFNSALVFESDVSVYIRFRDLFGRRAERPTLQASSIDDLIRLRNFLRLLFFCFSNLNTKTAIYSNRFRQRIITILSCLFICYTPSMWLQRCFL